jgi:hypothetical protein
VELVEVGHLPRIGQAVAPLGRVQEVFADARLVPAQQVLGVHHAQGLAVRLCVDERHARRAGELAQPQAQAFHHAVQAEQMVPVQAHAWLLALRPGQAGSKARLYAEAAKRNGNAYAS